MMHNRTHNRKIKIVLFGRTGSGKSSLCNKLAGQHLFDVGDTLVSQTSKTISKAVTLFDAPSYQVVLIDTPGFADNRIDMKNEDLLSDILSFLQDLGDGFNVGIYCLSARNRLDAHDIEEFRLIGTLLGQEVFQHTFIGVTQGNMLEREARMRICRNYPVDLPKILDEHGILGFGPEKILFADFDNFKERFVNPLTKIMDQSSLYCPEIAQEIDVHDPGSIRKFLATPQMQEIISHYENQLAKQGQELAQLRDMMVQKAEENRRMIKKSRQEMEMYKNNLEGVNQQLLSSQRFNEDLERKYSAYRQQQEAELGKLTNQLQRQQENEKRFHELIEKKENELRTIGGRIEELEGARQAGRSTFFKGLLGLAEKVVDKFIGKFFKS